MAFKTSVLIFGKSLYLAGIGVCLKNVEGLDVLKIDPQSPNAKQRLDALSPDALLFDLSNPPSDLDMALLRSNPDLLLIGVDPSNSEILVLKGQCSRVMTTNELNKLISCQTDPQMSTGL